MLSVPWRNAKGEQTTISPGAIPVADLWHIAAWLEDTDGQRTRNPARSAGQKKRLNEHLMEAGKAVREVWHNAHKMRKVLIDLPETQPLKIEKWTRSLVFWQGAGSGKTATGEEFQIGMEVNGRGLFVIFPEGWYAIKVKDLVEQLVAYRETHKDAPGDDEKPGEPAIRGRKGDAKAAEADKEG